MADQKHADKTKARNKRVLLGCVAVVGGTADALVPLDVEVLVVTLWKNLILLKAIG